MNCNIADKKDKNNIKALWACAFDEQEPFLSEYFDFFWEAENTLVLKSDENSLVASLQFVPYKISVREKIFSSSYIVGVSVFQEFRKKGFATQLMKSALYNRRNCGEMFSFLIPFNYDFYRKMGYETCYDVKEKTFTKEMLCKGNDIYTVKTVSFEDRDTINSIYNIFCANKNGYILRTDDDWKYIFWENSLYGGEISAIFDNEKIVGYFSYVTSDDTFFVRELVSTNENAHNFLLSLIFKKAKSFRNIKVRFSYDTNIDDVSIKPRAMMRVIDVKGTLLAFATEDITLEIEDNFITENNGVFKCTNGKVTKTDALADAKMTINSFSQLVLGYKSVYELSEDSKIFASCEIINKLNRMFPKKTNYLNHIMEE